MPNPEHLMIYTGTLTRVAQTGTEDRYGDPTEETETETVKCWLYQTDQSEATAESNSQLAGADLWLPAGTDPTGLDRITVDGTIWQFIGPPVKAMNPRTGVVSHIETKVRTAT